MSATQWDIMQRLHGENIWPYVNALDDEGDTQGWNGLHPALERLAVETRSKTIAIDVGVWKGQSTITIAKAMKRARIDGCVIAVDTFLGSPEHYLDPDYRKLLGRKNGRSTLYDRFLTNIIEADVADYVVPFAQTSQTAAVIFDGLGIKADLVHIDAAHDYAAVLQDAKSYWHLLAPGGSLIGDDYAPCWKGVVDAAQAFSTEVGCQLVIEDPKWIIRKPSTN